MAIAIIQSNGVTIAIPIERPISFLDETSVLSGCPVPVVVPKINIDKSATRFDIKKMQILVNPVTIAINNRLLVTSVNNRLSGNWSRNMGEDSSDKKTENASFFQHHYETPDSCEKLREFD